MHKPFVLFCLHIWNLNEVYNVVKKKNERQRSSVSEVIDSEKCAHLTS